MHFLGITLLIDLSLMIASNADGHPRSVDWIRAYREIVEWATLFKSEKGCR